MTNHTSVKKTRLCRIARKFWLPFFLAVFIPIATFLMGDGWLRKFIIWILSQPPSCISAKFDESNYKKAENAFLKEIKSIDLSNIPILWQENGSPRPLGEILVSQSNELSSLREAIANRRVMYSPNRLIFIFGSAGSGKSAVVSFLKNTGNSVALIDLSELRYDPQINKIHSMTQLVTDLKISDVEVSKMADLLPKEKNKNFMQLMTDVGGKKVINKKSIIIDGLDEIHPYSSTHILMLAHEYLTRNPKKNIIFIGRGEAFRGYIDKYGDKASRQTISLEPLYLNESEILRWYIAQFSAYRNENQNYNYIPDTKKIDEDFKQVTALVEKKEELRFFMQTTEPANTVLRNLRYANDVDKLIELQISDFLKRNTKTHNRPSLDQEKSDDASLLYKKALVQAARKLKLEQRPDGRITATVKPDDRINLQYKDKCYSVELYRVLDRSGIARLNPFHENQLEYTFQPMIMQKFISKNWDTD